MLRKITKYISIDSPILMIIFLVASVILSYKWYVYSSCLSAPAIPGWEWPHHQDTILVSYNDSCGCGPGVSKIIRQARSNNKEVLIIATKSSAQSPELKGLVLPERTFLIANVDPSLIKRLSPEKTTVFRIRNQRIVYRVTGGVLPMEFFTK